MATQIEALLAEPMWTFVPKVPPSPPCSRCKIVTRFVAQARAPQQQAPESASSPEYSHYQLTPAPAGRLASFSSMSSGARARAVCCGMCGSVVVVGVGVC